MATTVVMPKLGLVMKAGLVGSWTKREGDPIEQGEELLEIESDKVTTSVESPASGIVRRILAEPGQVIPCGKPIAVIAAPNEDIPDLDSLRAETQAVAMTRDDYERREQTPDEPAAPPPNPPPRARGPVKASPAAKRLARELGIDLAAVEGTGPGGRVVREDVEAAASMSAPHPPPSIAEAGAVADAETVTGRAGQTLPMTRMRRRIADNMARSWQAVARVVLFAEVDMTEAVRHREERWEAFSYNAVFVKAVADALREDPVLNVSLEDGAIRRHADVSVALAVALEDGLVTVSIKEADRKTLEQISAEADDLARMARAGSLDLDQITGSSITVSNLGAFEIESFTPIVNLPEVAILGVGGIVARPVARDGRVAVAPVAKLALAFDHRAVDGAPAARFLQRVKRKLESMDLE